MRKGLFFAVCIAAALVSVPHADSRFRHGGIGVGGGGGALTTLTVTEPSGNAQTNMPFTIGLPFAAGTIVAGQSVQVKDGVTTLLCDENNRASDQSPAVRNESLTCIIPSATAGEVKQLAASVISGAPATGTDITVADIIAAFTAASSYDVPVTFTNINGVAGTWTASLATALASGNSGWVDKSTNTVMGKYRSGGGLVTEYIVFAPAFKSGVADPQVHVMYDVTCYKAARSAVSGPNPILGCKIDPIIENSYIQLAAPVDNYYGLSIGTAGAIANFPNSTPAITLTLGAISGNNVAVTAGSSLFSLNSQGQVIANGTGIAVVNGYTDATHAQVNNYTNFASTTVSSGTYTLYGINHPYAASIYSGQFRTYFGFAHNPPTVESGSAYVGAQWNGGMLTGGPSDYFIAAKVLQNYTFSNSGYTNSLSNINAMGMNPMAYTNCGFGLYGGNVGDITCYLQTSGVRADIGVVPDWDIKALKRWDANAPQVIFGNSNRWGSMNFTWRDQGTGLNVSPCNAGTVPNCTGSTQWVTDSRYVGTPVAGPTNPITPWSPDYFSHDPESFYIAALLTGDYWYLKNQQQQAAYAPMIVNSTGTGIKRTQFIAPTACCGNDDRSNAWAIRSIIDSAFLTPDTTPNVLGITKTVANAWVDMEWDDAAHGTNFLYINNTGSGQYWETTGPHWTFLNNNGYALFEGGYNSFEYAHATEQGMLSASGTAFRDWWLQNAVNMVNLNTQARGEYMARWQYGSLFNVQSSCPGTQVATLSGVYDAVTKFFPHASSIGTSVNRTPAATMTLSATSGSAINATMSAGNYFTTTAAYVGAWLTTSDNGFARVVSVSDANHFVLDTTASQQFFTSFCNTLSGAPFGSTSYSNSQIVLPQPAPGDPIGTDFATYLASPGDDYFQLQQAGTLYAKEYGLSGGSTAYTTIYGWNGGNMLVGGFLYKYTVGLR